MKNTKRVHIEHFDSDDTWNIYNEDYKMVEPDFKTESDAIKFANENNWSIIL